MARRKEITRRDVQYSHINFNVNESRRDDEE